MGSFPLTRDDNEDQGEHDWSDEDYIFTSCLLSDKEGVIHARENQGIRGILTVIGRRNNKLKWELID